MPSRACDRSSWFIPCARTGSSCCASARVPRCRRLDEVSLGEALRLHASDTIASCRRHVGTPHRHDQPRKSHPGHRHSVKGTVRPHPDLPRYGDGARRSPSLKALPPQYTAPCSRSPRGAHERSPASGAFGVVMQLPRTTALTPSGSHAPARCPGGHMEPRTNQTLSA